MPATKTEIKHPLSTKTLTFDESKHTYVDNHGSRYTSVSRLIKRIAQPFNAPTIARDKAEREIPQDEQNREQLVQNRAAFLQAEWRQKGAAACELGTSIHEVIEAALNRVNPPHQPRDDREKALFAHAWDAANSILARASWHRAEMTLWSPRLYVAGTCDLLAVVGSTLHVIDWKTNAEIKRTGYQGQRCLSPVDHLEDCHLTHYTLQLSLYARLLRSEGYLQHIPPNITDIRLHVAHITETGVTWIPCHQLALETAELLLRHLTDHEAPF